MRFQVGDVVRGTQKGDKLYAVTNSKMKEGVVTRVYMEDGIERIDVVVKAHEERRDFEGSPFYHLQSDCFELCADLQFDASVVDEELEKLLFSRS